MLPAKVVDHFHSIRKGHPFPRCFLAVVDGRGLPRTLDAQMVGFNFKKGLFYLATDQELDLAGLLEAHPKFELGLACWDKKQQLRCLCDGTQLDDSEMRTRFWQKYSNRPSEAPPWNFFVIEANIEEIECRYPGSNTEPLYFRRFHNGFLESTRTH